MEVTKVEHYLTHLTTSAPGEDVPYHVLDHEILLRLRRTRKLSTPSAKTLSITYGLRIMHGSELRWLKVSDEDKKIQENSIADIGGGSEGRRTFRETYRRFGASWPISEAEITYWQGKMEQASGLLLAQTLGAPSLQSIRSGRKEKHMNLLFFIIWQRRKGRKLDTRNFRTRLLKEKLNA